MKMDTFSVIWSVGWTCLIRPISNRVGFIIGFCGSKRLWVEHVRLQHNSTSNRVVLIIGFCDSKAILVVNTGCLQYSDSFDGFKMNAKTVMVDTWLPQVHFNIISGLSYLHNVDNTACFAFYVPHIGTIALLLWMITLDIPCSLPACHFMPNTNSSFWRGHFPHFLQYSMKETVYHLRGQNKRKLLFLFHSHPGPPLYFHHPFQSSDRVRISHGSCPYQNKLLKYSMLCL